MSIAQRANGRWIVKFKDPLNGAWRQRSFKDKYAAYAFEEEMLYDRKDNEKMTLGDCIVAFLANVPHSPQTVEDYSFLINGYDRKRDGGHTEGPAEFLANKYCIDLTRRDLENLRLRLRERGQKPKTINHNVGSLKAAMNWAVEQELIPDNPWAKYKGVPGGRSQAGSRKGTLENFLRIYVLLPPWFQWACRTALALCLRPGIKELFSLKWSAFDWRARTVTIYMSKVARDKTVYPPSWYMEEAWARFQADRAAGRDLVCPGGRGGQIMTTSGYRKTWVYHCQRAGVYMPPYAIRHIAASEMLGAGVDLATVAAQLGHATPVTTALYYAHAIPKNQRAASAALPELHQNGADGAGFSDKKIEITAG